MDAQPSDHSQPISPLAASRTLAAAAADRLREAILLGRLKPGTLLSQADLARQLGVSRIPLREALQLLTAEGLVVWRAHRTAIVSGLTADDMLELYELGATTEATAAAQGVMRATPEHIRAVGELVEAMADPNISATDWHLINRRFHAMLIEPAEWPRFQRIISEVRANTGRHVKAYLEETNDIHRWQDEHREIFQAYQARDAHALAEIIKRHWQHTSETLQRHLRATPEARQQGRNSIVVRNS